MLNDAVDNAEKCPIQWLILRKNALNNVIDYAECLILWRSYGNHNAIPPAINLQGQLGVPMAGNHQLRTMVTQLLCKTMTDCLVSTTFGSSCDCWVGFLGI